MIMIGEALPLLPPVTARQSLLSMVIRAAVILV